MAYSKAKLRSNVDKASLFYTILNRKCYRHIFTYADFTIAFVNHILISLNNDIDT